MESVSKLFSIAISCQIKNYEGSDTNHRFAKLCAKFAEMFHSTPPPFLFTNTYTLRITVLTSTSKLCMSLIKIAENKTQEVISCLSDHKSVAQILMKKNDVKKLLRIVIEMLLTAL